ncbi:hypothetical protein YC2023_064112 [Brassica napus]
MNRILYGSPGLSVQQRVQVKVMSLMCNVFKPDLDTEPDDLPGCWVTGSTAGEPQAVRRDNKQRFSLVEEDGELLIRANQGHSVTTVVSEKLLKPILSPEEAPVCVHGTYKKNLESILASGLKRMNKLHVHFSCGLPIDGEVISALVSPFDFSVDGIAFYVSDNKVILTEGIDGVVPVDYFHKIESWPSRQPIPF